MTCTLHDFKRRFVSRLLRSGKATADDGRAHPKASYSKQERNAVGTYVNAMKRKGLIFECGRPRSNAQCRHDGLTRRWRVADRQGLERLAQTIGGNDAEPTLFDLESREGKPEQQQQRREPLRGRLPAGGATDRGHTAADGGRRGKGDQIGRVGAVNRRAKGNHPQQASEVAVHGDRHYLGRDVARGKLLTYSVVASGWTEYSTDCPPVGA